MIKEDEEKASILLSSLWLQWCCDSSRMRRIISILMAPGPLLCVFFFLHISTPHTYVGDTLYYYDIALIGRFDLFQTKYDARIIAASITKDAVHYE